MSQPGLPRAAASRVHAEGSSSVSAQTTAQAEAARLRYEIAILEAKKRILKTLDALGA